MLINSKFRNIALMSTSLLKTTNSFESSYLYNSMLKLYEIVYDKINTDNTNYIMTKLNAIIYNGKIDLTNKNARYYYDFWNAFFTINEFGESCSIIDFKRYLREHFGDTSQIYLFFNGIIESLDSNIDDIEERSFSFNYVNEKSSLNMDFVARIDEQTEKIVFEEFKRDVFCNDISDTKRYIPHYVESYLKLHNIEFKMMRIECNTITKEQLKTLYLMYHNPFYKKLKSDFHLTNENWHCFDEIDRLILRIRQADSYYFIGNVNMMDNNIKTEYIATFRAYRKEKFANQNKILVYQLFDTNSIKNKSGFFRLEVQSSEIIDNVIKPDHIIIPFVCQDDDFLFEFVKNMDSVRTINDVENIIHNI